MQFSTFLQKGFSAEGAITKSMLLLIITSISLKLASNPFSTATGNSFLCYNSDDRAASILLEFFGI